jgi:hypothetical protein
MEELAMSKPKKNKTEKSLLKIYKQIRKPMPKPSKPHNGKKKEAKNWKDLLGEE